MTLAKFFGKDRRDEECASWFLTKDAKNSSIRASISDHPTISLPFWTIGPQIPPRKLMSPKNDRIPPFLILSFGASYWNRTGNLTATFGLNNTGTPNRQPPRLAMSASCPPATTPLLTICARGAAGVGRGGKGTGSIWRKALSGSNQTAS